jgi:hypothetical protein
MVLRWSTSKIVFSDPDLGPKWLPSAYSNPIGFYVKTMSAHGSHLGWRSWSLDTILKVYYPRTIHAVFAFTRNTEKNIPMIYRPPYPWYLSSYQWYFDALPMSFWPPTHGISPPLIHGSLTHIDSGVNFHPWYIPPLIENWTTSFIIKR